MRLMSAFLSNTFETLSFEENVIGTVKSQLIFIAGKMFVLKHHPLTTIHATPLASGESSMGASYQLSRS